MYACMYALRSLPVAVVVVAVLCAVVADAGAQPPSHLRSNRSRRAGTDELHRSDPLVFFSSFHFDLSPRMLAPTTKLTQQHPA